MSDKKFQKKLEKIRKRGERYKQEYELKAEYAKYVPYKKKKKVSNIMLVIIVIAIVGYTIASFWVQYRTGVPIDATLSTLYYSFWTVELIALAGIKVSKTKHNAENSFVAYDCTEIETEEDCIDGTYE